MQTIAFTGHRPQKFKERPADIREKVQNYLLMKIAEHKDVRILSGGALGIDQIAAEEAFKLGLRVWFILPFPAAVMGTKWSSRQRDHLAELMRQAVKSYYISKDFDMQAYQTRNEALVSKSDVLCAYWNGAAGGTANCIEYAKTKNRTVEKLPCTQTDAPRKTRNRETWDRKASACFRFSKAEYGALSNSCAGYKINVNGFEIDTTEALYQACKFPHLPELQRRIIDETPTNAKILSRGREKDTRKDWDTVRFHIMKWCVQLKLTQNKAFKTVLESTGNKDIVEESTKDSFWGAIQTDRDTLTGANMLGHVLMSVRYDIDREFVHNPASVKNFKLCGETIKEQ